MDWVDLGISKWRMVSFWALFGRGFDALQNLLSNNKDTYRDLYTALTFVDLQTLGLYYYVIRLMVTTLKTLCSLQQRKVSVVIRSGSDPVTYNPNKSTIECAKR